MTETMNDLPQAIQDGLNDLEAVKAQILALTDAALVAHEVAAMFPDLNPHVMVNRSCIAYISIDLRDVTSLHDVLPVLAEIAKRGWRLLRDKSFTDSPEYGWRTYNLTRRDADLEEDCSFDSPFRVIAMVKIADAPGPGCRRVQVGTKEVPVYEIVCDD